MSKLMEDITSLINEPDQAEREAKAALLDQCIDQLVAEATPDEELARENETLKSSLAEAQSKADLYRDRFIDLYYGRSENGTNTAVKQDVPKPMQGAKGLCGWEL